MKTERERAAFHEAGHFIVGTTLGHNYDVTLSIVPDTETGTVGRVIGESPIREDMPSRDKIEAHVAACCAGYLAQRRFDPDEPEAIALEGASSDFREADRWNDIVTRAEGTQIAGAILHEQWRQVTVVARALVRRSTLSAEEADFLTIVASGSDDERAKAAYLLVEHGWTMDELEVLAEEFDEAPDWKPTDG